MTTNIRPLLVELLTEELPPKALQKLGQAYAEGVRATLARHGLLADGCTVTAYSTPRRLAVHLSAVLAQAPSVGFSQSSSTKRMSCCVGSMPSAFSEPM